MLRCVEGADRTANARLENGGTIVASAHRAVWAPELLNPERPAPEERGRHRIAVRTEINVRAAEGDLIKRKGTGYALACGSDVAVPKPRRPKTLRESREERIESKDAAVALGAWRDKAIFRAQTNSKTVSAPWGEHGKGVNQRPRSAGTNRESSKL